MLAFTYILSPSPVGGLARDLGFAVASSAKLRIVDLEMSARSVRLSSSEAGTLSM
jgi:hypothetical protein